MFGLRRPRPAVRAATPAPVAATLPDRVTVIDDDSFFDRTQDGYIIVDFWASWCGPCRAFSPIFHAVAAEHDGAVRFGSCDIERNPQTAELLQIRSIPTLVVFGPDGSEVGRSSDAVSRGELEATTRQLSNR